MASDTERKKHHTTRELITGSGILLVGLPFVATALLFAGLAVAISVALLMGGESNQSSAYLFMLLVYSAAILSLVYFSLRVVKRSAHLIKRLRGIKQEQKRTEALAEYSSARQLSSRADASRLALAETEPLASSDFADDSKEQHTRR
jgi:hypothetical protein